MGIQGLVSWWDWSMWPKYRHRVRFNGQYNWEALCDRFYFILKNFQYDFIMFTSRLQFWNFGRGRGGKKRRKIVICCYFWSCEKISSWSNNQSCTCKLGLKVPRIKLHSFSRRGDLTDSFPFCVRHECVEVGMEPTTRMSRWRGSSIFASTSHMIMEHAMSVRGLANSDHVHSQFPHNYRAHVNIICFIKVKILVLIT